MVLFKPLRQLLSQLPLTLDLWPNPWGCNELFKKWHPPAKWGVQHTVTPPHWLTCTHKQSWACSRAASQNSLLTANLQTREKPGCGTDFSLWPPAIALHYSHDFSILVFFGRLGVKKIIWNFHIDWQSWDRDHLFLRQSPVYFGRLSRPMDVGAHGGNPVQYLTLLDTVRSQTCI